MDLRLPCFCAMAVREDFVAATRETFTTACEVILRHEEPWRGKAVDRSVLSK